MLLTWSKLVIFFWFEPCVWACPNRTLWTVETLFWIHVLNAYVSLEHNPSLVWHQTTCWTYNNHYHYGIHQIVTRYCDLCVKSFSNHFYLRNWWPERKGNSATVIHITCAATLVSNRREVFIWYFLTIPWQHFYCLLISTTG